MEFKIAWMFPDILFIHGERGNVLALERYAKEAGYDSASVDRIDFDTKDFCPECYDAIVFGVGEISSFEAIIEWMQPSLDSLTRFIEAGRPMIATGTTMAMFAQRVDRADGSSFQGIGYLPAVAKENTAVYGDDILYDCVYNNVEMQIFGSQIAMMDMVEDNSSTAPASGFGTLVYGYGNTGKDRKEGYIYKNAVFTSALGPALICNPWLTVEMIKAASEFNGFKMKEIDSTFELERASFEAKKAFALNKTTNLKNCI